MSEIIVDLNGFPAEFPIYKAEGAGVKNIGYCNVDTAKHVVLQFCLNYGINKIHLLGNTPFITELASDFKSNTEYSIQNLEVEIN